MTITVTDLEAGPYVATGATQTVPFSFMSLSDAEVSVIVVTDDLGESPLAAEMFAVQRNRELDGSPTEGGSVTLSPGAILTGSTFYLRANPSDEQDQRWSDTGSRLRNLNDALDRSTLRHLILKRAVSQFDPTRLPAAFSSLNVSFQAIGAEASIRDVRSVLADLGKTPEDFGAKGDWNPETRTGTDDTAALQRYFDAIAEYAQGAVSKVFARIPAKFYRYTSPLNVNVSGLSLVGAGSGTSGFVYDGMDLDTDTFVFGTDGGLLLNCYIAGLRWCCNRNMTGGHLVRAKGLINTTIFDVQIQGQDHSYYAGGRMHHGWWFDGIGYVFTESFYVDSGAGDNLVVTPHTTNAAGAGYPYTGLVLGKGKIGGAAGRGVHIAGGVGGYINQGTDVIGNGVNTRLSQDRYARNHEQSFHLCFDDSSTVGANIEIDEPETGQSGGTLHIASWLGTARTHGLHIKRAPRWNVVVQGAGIANNLFGDGIRVDDATTDVMIGGNYFIDHPNGYCINPTVAGHKVQIGENFFAKNNPQRINGTFQSSLRPMSGPSQSTDFYAGLLTFKASNNGYNPINNRDVTFDFVSNTQVRLRMKGDDGVIRSASLTLS